MSDLLARKSAADSGSPAIDQLALADLTSFGEYERHIARVRHAYRRRRDLLVRALNARLPRLQVLGAGAGMQLLLPLADDTDDVALAEAAATQGLNISPLSPLHFTPSPQRGLLAGFGRLAEHKINTTVDSLVSVLISAGATPRAREQMNPLCVAAQAGVQRSAGARTAALGAKSDQVPVTERNAAVVAGSICGWPDPRVLYLQPAPR